MLPRAVVLIIALLTASAAAFTALVPVVSASRGPQPLGAKKDAWKDEQMRAQNEILARRRSQEGRLNYFQRVNAGRAKANAEVDKWAFQSRVSSEDPLIAWKKLRAEGKIGDLKTGLGVDGKKREGGIPIPLPSFGVGGEAGVGGQYDNGERFDLRLPYVDQGYVDEDADVMKKLSGFFSGLGGGKKEAAEAPGVAKEEPKKPTSSSFKWPWEQ